MNTDILIPVLTLSAISIGLGYLLTMTRVSPEDNYDERQLIERGKAASFSMVSAEFYLLGLLVGYLLNLFQPEQVPVLAAFGLVVIVLTYSGVCVFRDAYLRPSQKYGAEILHQAFLGSIWMFSFLLSANLGHSSIDWLRLALGLEYLSVAAMLTVRLAILKHRERTEKVDDDGEE